MEYNRDDSFPSDFEPNGIRFASKSNFKPNGNPFGSKLKGKLKGRKTVTTVLLSLKGNRNECSATSIFGIEPQRSYLRINSDKARKNCFYPSHLFK